MIDLMFLGNPVALAANVDLIQRSKTSGHVLMIRYATAPGMGDPPNFKTGDRSTQRNLDERGRAEARSIGDWMCSQGIR